MILVDSSVWIDYFRGRHSRQADRLDALLGREALLTGDLILVEILQGFSREQDFNQALKLLTTLPVVEIGGKDVAIQAARNYRLLRSRGVTTRKTIDTVIATRCIENGLTLLHSDQDFEPFERYLGLKSIH